MRNLYITNTLQMKKLFLIILFTMTVALTNAQSVRNIRFEQSGKQIVIYYDLSGAVGSTWNVTIYCSQDGGKTWGNPLQNLSGAFGFEIRPGNNQKVLWDVLADRDKLEGEISFKVEATKNEDLAAKKTESVPIPAEKSPEKAIEKIANTAKPSFLPEYYKYKRRKNFWLGSTIVTAGIGTYSYLQANNYYSQYKNATTDAFSLHMKVKSFDTITPIAFGIAGFCALEYIITAGKQKKVKRQSMSLYPLPLLNKGAGLAFVYSF